MGWWTMSTIHFTKENNNPPVVASSRKKDKYSSLQLILLDNIDKSRTKNNN